MKATKKLSGHYLEQILERVAQGDIVACQELAEDTLRYYASTPKVAIERRDLIYKSEKSGVVEVLGLLCTISACVGDFKFCDFWLDDVEKSGEPYFGYLIYTYLRSTPLFKEKPRYYLRRSAQAGYLMARKEQVKLGPGHLPLLGTIIVALHAVYIATIGAAIYARNPRDRRLPRLCK